VSDLKDLDTDELVMLSQYIQNQQQIINELTEKNMQLTTEVQVQRLRIKELEKINKVKSKPKRRTSPFVLERLQNHIK
jgi:tRNA uridine 5-carbamoylmethylation protein Kti12